MYKTRSARNWQDLVRVLADYMGITDAQINAFPSTPKGHSIDLWLETKIQPLVEEIEARGQQRTLKEKNPVAVAEESAEKKAGLPRALLEGTVFDAAETYEAIGDPNYAGLYQILLQAFMQAARGKGYERHNLGGQVPFEKQRMQQICELLNTPHGMTYQVVKKLTEGLSHPTLEMKVKELHGAIIYIAGIIVFLQAREAEAQANHDRGV